MTIGNVSSIYMLRTAASNQVFPGPHNVWRDHRIVTIALVLWEVHMHAHSPRRRTSLQLLWTQTT